MILLWGILPTQKEKRKKVLDKHIGGVHSPMYLGHSSS